MNIAQVFATMNNGFSVLFLGYNVMQSYHHIYAQQLSAELNNGFNQLKTTYLKYDRTNDYIDYDEIQSAYEFGVIVSSDIIPSNVSFFTFVFFIETPLSTLRSRGFTGVLNTVEWNQIKQFNIGINKIVIDKIPILLNSFQRVYNVYTYDFIWDTFINFIKEELNK